MWWLVLLAISAISAFARCVFPVPAAAVMRVCVLTRVSAFRL